MSIPDNLLPIDRDRSLIRRHRLFFICKPERQIWADIFADYSLESRASIAVLTTSLEAHQRARECREIITRDGPTVEGRDGQVKAHPLLAAERDARAAWLAGIKTLGLEL